VYKEFEREPTPGENVLMHLTEGRRLEEKYGKRVEIRFAELDTPTVRWVRKGDDVKMVLPDYLYGAKVDVCMDMVEHVLKAITGDPQDGFPESVKEWFESAEFYKMNIDKYLLRNYATMDMVTNEDCVRLYHAYSRAQGICACVDVDCYALHMGWAKEALPGPMEVSNIFNTVLVDRRLLKASDDLLTYLFCRAIGELAAESMFTDIAERKALAFSYASLWDPDAIGEALMELKRLMPEYDIEKME
jgi:hypothetical protein